MKRSLPATYVSSISYTPCNQRIPTNSSYSFDPGLDTSLKRVKLSTSPGELRLSKDFDQLIIEHNYSMQSFGVISSDGKIVIRKDPLDALHISIDFVDEWTFRVKMPRMYPHSLPVIYQFGKYSLCNNMSRTPRNFRLSLNPKEPSVDARNAIAIYRWWTPISRLVDLIAWLQGVTQDTEVKNVEMKEYLGVESWLMSNRFDVGYRKADSCHTQQILDEIHRNKYR